jgi:hypothetical protein
MRRLWIPLCIIVIIVGVYLVAADTARSRERAAINALQAAGHPTTLEEIEPLFRTGSESTARIIEQACDLLTKDDVATLALRDSIGWPADQSVAAEFLRDKANVCKLILQASTMPPADFGMKPGEGYAAKLTSILPKWQAFRRLLRLQARELAAQGKPDSALDVLAAAVRLSNAFGEPIFIYHLVSMVGLDSVIGCAGEIAPRAGTAVIDRFVRDLERLDFKSAERRALEAENMMTSISARTGQVTDASAALKLAVFLVRSLPPVRDYALTQATEMAREELEILPKPWHEGWNDLARIESAGRRPGIEGALTRIYTPNVSVFYARTERATAWRDVAALGLKALVASRQAGRPPAALSDFAPTAPPDRFTGRPYVYRTLPDGFIVYSVGPNQQDENGTGADDRAFRVKL